MEGKERCEGLNISKERKRERDLFGLLDETVFPAE
jgi:hypothetical protein